MATTQELEEELRLLQEEAKQALVNGRPQDLVAIQEKVMAVTTKLLSSWQQKSRTKTAQQFQREMASLMPNDRGSRMILDSMNRLRHKKKVD